MELIDRYLQAIGYWIPKAQREDIIAELSEDIRSQIQNKETELGCKLDASEVGAILKRSGDPLLVAQGYLPQQHLIGPILFPIYRFVLKMFVLFYVLPYLILWLGYVILSPAYRAQYPLQQLGGLWSAVVHALFFLTLGFAVVQKFKIESLTHKDWDPSKLPPVRDRNQIPRSNSVFGLAVGFTLVVWWASVLQFGTEFELVGRRTVLAHGWWYFLGGLLLVSLVAVAISSVNLVRPFWTRLRAVIHLINDSVGSILLCWLLKSSILAEIVALNTPPAQIPGTTNAINTGLAALFPVAVIVCAVTVLLDVRRIFRVRTNVSRLAELRPQTSGSH